MAFRIDSLHKGEVIATTYVPDNEDKAFLTLTNANVKEGSRSDSLAVINAVVTKDAEVTFLNKGGLINLKKIQIKDGDKVVRQWDFTKRFRPRPQQLAKGCSNMECGQRQERCLHQQSHPQGCRFRC